MFFKSVQTLEDLKKQYKKLAFAHHPDRGGDLETMKAINNEYDELFKNFKNRHFNRKGDIYEKETKEEPSEYRDIIDAIIRMKGVHLDVVGIFLWVYGDTKPYKEQLKKFGFKWSRDKKKWYKSPNGYRRRGRGQYSYDQITSMYGVRASYDGETENAIAV